MIKYEKIKRNKNIFYLTCFISIQMFAYKPEQMIYNQLHKIHDLHNLLHDLQPVYIKSICIYISSASSKVSATSLKQI